MAMLMRPWFAPAALLAALCATPAVADVKAGVDAWSRGNYAGAVHEWEGPAAAGDPDAMFNLAQAYRLGRGVPEDLARAEALYSKAAALGHLQAADTYGLLLFQDGRRAQALPYIEDAARRGDPRSQYLLGIAHFNGDIVPQDWVRAYALVSLASAQGLPQAIPAIRQMDEHIPLAQRQMAAGLAVQMQAQADAARAREFAAAELGTPASPGPSTATASGKLGVSPSVAAAREAVAQARQATGTEDPADAGASFARANRAPSAAIASSPQQVPVRVNRPEPVPTVPERRAVAAASGPWRVQLGAFSVPSNAERLWRKLSARSELAGKERLLVPSGAVTKLQAGGYSTRSTAEAACRSLKGSGQDCLVTRD